MITAYCRSNGTLSARTLAAGTPLPPDTVWLDLLRPTEDERAQVAAMIGVSLPSKADMQEIEASSRIYADGESSFLTAPVVTNADTPQPVAGAVTFVLTPRLLVTLRYVEPKSLAVFADRAQRQPHVCATPQDTMLTMLEMIVDRSADVLELIGNRLETLSQRVFGMSDATVRRTERDLQAVLRGVGGAGDLLGKIRDSLAGLDRIVVYLASQTPARDAKEARARLKTMQRDLHSLAEHAAFQAQRVSFLLDATLGVISVEQNTVVKSFTVAATVFFPPTLIASIYGMNFDIMPELHWAFGYPMALGLMVLSAALPLWYFRRRGWF